MSAAGSSEGMSSEIPGGPEAPARKPWGKIAAVIIVLIVIIAAIAAYSLRGNRAPAISQVAVSSQSAEVDDSLTFTAQASDPDGDSLSYAWDFGDGTTGSGLSATHSYAVSGRFIALLTVTDARGASVTNDGNLLFVQVKLKAADVREPSPPTPAACPSSCTTGPAIGVLSADNTTVATGSVVRFNGLSSWGYTFAWTNTSNYSEGGSFSVVTAADDSTFFTSFSYAWGDGSAATTGNTTVAGTTSHTFSAVGNYFVKLTLSLSTITGAKTYSTGYTVRVVAATPPVLVKYPDIFTEVTIGEPQFLDPAVDYETAGGEVLQNVYETLIWYQQGTESVTVLVPRLATVVPSIANGGISADGKNYTFTLRTGVQFHSGGTNMTADDVVYSIQRVLAIHDPDGPSWILE